MNRMALLPLVSILLLLAGTECVPRNLERQKNSTFGQKWRKEPIARQTSCSVNTDPLVASSGVIGIGSLGGTYNNNENCVWEIEVPQGSTIQFIWNYFDLEGASPGCPWDYVTVSEYATGEALTGKLCDSQTPANFISNSNKVKVTFTSDSSVVRQGFSLSFEAISDTTNTATTTATTTGQLECSVNAGRIGASSGEIGIGSLGGTYNNNENCVWEIEVPQGSAIQFTWNYFDLEGTSPGCPYDYVTVSEYATGEALTGRLCDSQTPDNFMSSSNMVMVTFTSDYSVVTQGFSLSFEAISAS